MDHRIQCLLSRPFFDQDIRYLKEHSDGRIEYIMPEEYSSAGFGKLPLPEIEAIMGLPPEIDVLRQMTALRLIQIPWTGVENIDFHHLEDTGIALCNSHSNAGVVAEYALALALALIKQIPDHDAQLRISNWRRPVTDSKDFVPPVSLQDKEVLIIGYGAIGQKIAAYLQGFPVRITGVVNRKTSVTHTTDVTIQSKADLSALLKKSDIIFITVPLTSATRGLLGRRQLALMKSTAYLINVSRGAIIDEHDLFAALTTGQIAGAAIDTWYHYPPRGENHAKPSRYNFERLSNVIMSPHRAGLAVGLLPHLADAVDNLNRLVDGRELINQVDLKEMY